MEVSPTIVLFEAKQAVHHLCFAEVAVEASTNDTWVSLSSGQILLNFLLRKKKRKTRVLQKFSLLSGACDVLD